MGNFYHLSTPTQARTGLSRDNRTRVLDARKARERNHGGDPNSIKLGRNAAKGNGCSSLSDMACIVARLSDSGFFRFARLTTRTRENPFERTCA